MHNSNYTVISFGIPHLIKHLVEESDIIIRKIKLSGIADEHFLIMRQRILQRAQLLHAERVLNGNKRVNLFDFLYRFPGQSLFYRRKTKLSIPDFHPVFREEIGHQRQDGDDRKDENQDLIALHAAGAVKQILVMTGVSTS